MTSSVHHTPRSPMCPPTPSYVMGLLAGEPETELEYVRRLAVTSVLSILNYGPSDPDCKHESISEYYYDGLQMYNCRDCEGRYKQVTPY